MIGIENSVISVGTLASAVSCTFLNKKLKNVKLSFIISADILTTCIAFLLMGVWLKAFYGFFSTTANVLLFMLLNLIIVVANGFLSINLSAQFQSNVPNELMGRIGSFVNAALLVSTPLGEVVSGLMLSKFSYSSAYFAGGAFCTLLFVYCITNGKKVL
mgnify:FL=1